MSSCISLLRLLYQNSELGGNLFFFILDGRSPWSKYYQGWFLVRALFLACKQPPSPGVLTWPFFWVRSQKENFWMSLLLRRTPVWWDEGLTLNIYYLFMGPLSKDSSISGEDFSTWIGGGDPVQSIIGSKLNLNHFLPLCFYLRARYSWRKNTRPWQLVSY